MKDRWLGRSHQSRLVASSAFTRNLDLKNHKELLCRS